MHPYSARDVERLVRVPRSRIRSLVEAGFVSPERGPRNSWRFSFQDLILLRTAQALADAHVPHQRITRSVKELRRRLPDSMPLSGLNIAAEDDRVVIREGTRRWNPESGQYLLRFEGNPDEGSLSGLEREDALERATARPRPTPFAPFASSGPPSEAEDWFDRGAALEENGDRKGAIEAYERAIAADPALLRARINLGCLLHETRRYERAEQVYRDAPRSSGDDPVLLYNLGVLLDDVGRLPEAIEAYRGALRGDPSFADCHYNLALLYERLKKPKDAIRHMAAYRRLTSKTS